MGDIFSAADWIAALLFGGALGMTALTQKELAAAKVMIWFAAALFAAHWGLWAMTTGMGQPWWVRTIIGALVGGFLLGAIPAAFNYINGKSEGGTANAAPSGTPTSSPPGTSVSTTNQSGGQAGTITNTGPVFNAPVTINPPPATPPHATAKPNISFQKFALFWVQTDKDVYQIGIVAKLFDEGGQSYLVNGLSFDSGQVKFIPRGGYFLGRMTVWQFPGRVELIDDNFIKANDVVLIKVLLPIRYEMIVKYGDMPDLELSGHWTIHLDKASQAISPRAYSAYGKILTTKQWEDLTKPKSPIQMDDLDYKPFEPS